MPIQIQAPNGDIVEFPDGTSDDVMAGAMRQTYGGPSPEPKVDSPPSSSAQQPADTFQRSTILPLGKDTKTGEIQWAVPGLLKGLFEAGTQAVTAPGRAMSGELQVMGPDGNVTPQAIGEGLNFAGMFAGGTPAAGSGKTIAALAAEKAGPVAKPGMEAAAAAARLGVDLPRAVASDSIPIQQGGKILTNIPVGGTPLRQASQTAIDQLGQAAQRVQQGYGAGDVASAGATVRQGIKDYSANTLDAAIGKKYDVVDSLINPNVTSPLSETQKLVDKIRNDRFDAALPPDGAATGIVSDAIGRDGLTYSGIKRLRTTVGGYLKNPTLAPAGASQDELKAIYGSLTDDLKNAVQASDHATVSANLAGAAPPPVNKALNAFQDANSFANTTIAEQKKLDSIIAPQSDEGLFSKIQSMAGSTSTADLANLARARKAVSPDAWNEVSSAVISKMGRDPDGNFSPDRFITAYGKLSKNGKNMLFKGANNNDLASSLDDIAAVSRRFKQLNQYANPSGTGQAVIGGSYLPMIWTAPTTLLSSVASARVMSSLLAKPVSAKALANYAQAYERSITAPSRGSSQLLTHYARAVAGLIANESGDKSLASQILPTISRVGQAPADQGNENNGTQENQ